MNERPDEWDKHLDAVMFGLKTKQSSTVDAESLRVVGSCMQKFCLCFNRNPRFRNRQNSPEDVALNPRALMCSFVILSLSLSHEC